MSDEFDRHAGVAIDLLLERKDHEDEVRDLADRLQAAGAPRPDLRADVVDDGNAEPFELTRQRKIEIRKIDRDGDVGAIRLRRRHQAPQRRPRAWNLPDRFGEARDGKAAVIVEEAAAGIGELRAAEAFHRHAAIDRAQFARQRTRVQIAGWLSARQQNAGGQGPGRLKRAGSIGALNVMLLTCRSPSCRPLPNAVVVNGTWMPSTPR